LRWEGRSELPPDRPMPVSRVVVTGMGVLAPNGHGLRAFESALREGRSGITARPELTELNFACQVAGVPSSISENGDKYFDPSQQLGMDRSSIIGGIAAADCWHDAGLESDPDFPDWDTSIVFGTAFGSLDTVNRVLLPLTSAAKVRRMGS